VGLGNLKTYGGLRQGSQSYNIDRLKKYLYYGDGTYDDLVNTLLNEAMNDQLESLLHFTEGKSYMNCQEDGLKFRQKDKDKGG